MPGIFSPVVDESGTEIQVVNPSVENNIGQSLASIGNLIGNFAQSGGGSGGDGSTQTERDRELLRPFLEEAIDLKKMNQSGNLPPFKFRAMAEDIMDRAVVAAPGASDSIKGDLHSILGLDLDLPDISPEETLLAGQIDWASTQAGQYYAAASMVFDQNGQFDALASKNKFDKFYLAYIANQVDLQIKKDQIASLEADTKMQEVARQETAREVTARHNQEALTQVQGLVTNFSKQLQTGEPVDATVVLSELNNVIGQAEALYSADMAALGAGKEQINTELALAPLYALRTAVETNRDNLGKMAENLRALDEVTIRNMMTKLTGLPPTSEDSYSYLFENFMFGKIDQIRTKLETPDAFLTERNNILNSGGVLPSEDAEGNPTIPSGVDGFANPEVISRIQGMSEEDKQRAAKGLFTMFSTQPVDTFHLPDGKENAVKSFVAGVAALSAQREFRPLTNNTLKEIYSPEFMKRYEVITSSDDMNSAAMKEAVKFHLYHQFDAKATLLEQELRHAGGTLVLVNGQIQIEQNGEILPGGVNRQRTTRENLDRSGLAIGPSGRGSGVPVGTPEQQAAEFRMPNEKLRELNEVYQIMRRFPDLRDTFVGSVTERLTPRLKFVEARSIEDYNNAPAGSVVLIYNENGELATTTIKE